MKSFVAIAFSLLLLSGCATLPSAAKPVLTDQGELHVFLEPFPYNAAKLTVAIENISAVRKDGESFPLLTVAGDLKGNDNRRQRLVASGPVPPGEYVGLSYQLTSAAVKLDDGDSILPVPEGEIKQDFFFEIRAAKAAVLSLTLRDAQFAEAGFKTVPEFSLAIPMMPAPGVIGYVVNQGDNSVTLFDKKTGRVASLIATGGAPHAMALDGKAGKGYLSLTREDTIEVIDITEEGPVHRIQLNTGDGPTELSMTPDKRFLLSLNLASQTLGIIDPVSLVETNRVPLGEGPRTLLVGRNGVRCYVFNTFSNTISVIDIVNAAVVGTIPTEEGPLMGQFNRKGDRLYVIHESSPYLLVIDPLSFSVVRKVFVGPGLRVIKVDPATDMLYAYRAQDVRIEVYDPFSLVAGDYLMAVSGVVRMTIDGELNVLHVLSSEKSRLLSIDLTTKKIVSETAVGSNPSWVTMRGER